MDSTHRFAAIAEEYCAWARTTPCDASTEDERARELLPRLYLAAQLLPAGVPLEVEPQPPACTESEWQVVYKRFGALSVGYYSDTFDPLIVPPEEATISDVADDLADIYRDLLAGLVHFEAGRRAEAAWQWRFHFSVHWDAHLVGALRALHHAWSKNAV